MPSAGARRVALPIEALGEFLRTTSLFKGLDAAIIERLTPHLIASCATRRRIC